MKKYRCPICKTIYTVKVNKCPGCGQEIHYLDELNLKTIKSKKDDAKPEPEVEEKAIEENEVQKLSKNETEVSQDTKIKQNEDLDYVEDISKYDGNSFAKVFLVLGLSLLSIITLGIFTPWAFCIVFRWTNKHTIIDGHRLSFDGKGGQLLGRWILWMFLTIITAGIFVFWIPHYVRKWKAKHTHLLPIKK